MLKCRTDAFIGMKALEVILNMPVSLVEAAPVDTDFTAETIRNMRDFFNGTLASSVIDVPFIFIFRIARLAVGRKSRFGSRLVQFFHIETGRWGEYFDKYSVQRLRRTVARSA